MSDEEEDTVPDFMNEYGDTAVTGDAGPIYSSYQWEETVDVSEDDE